MTRPFAPRQLPSRRPQHTILRNSRRDRRTPAHWNSAALSPQWIELALTDPADVESIVLTVAQDPPGPSTHQIWVRQMGGELTLMHTFDGQTAEGDVLTFRPEKPLLEVDLVKVVTTKVLDLWPAWHEIEILTATSPR